MKLEHIYKEYRKSNETIKVLNDINIEFKTGKFYAIMGRSGSGKSTLINILGLMDEPTSGKYYFENVDTTSITENQKSNIRGLKIGFIFQTFYLNKNLTAYENVSLPLYINNNINSKEREKIILDLMKKLNIENRKNHKPSELSGGEEQRVCIARALVNDPSIIIADEPTGNLDSKTEKEVFEILKKLTKENKTVIVVSHNPIIKQYCDILYELKDSSLFEVKNENKWFFKINTS